MNRWIETLPDCGEPAKKPNGDLIYSCGLVFSAVFLDSDLSELAPLFNGAHRVHHVRNHPFREWSLLQDLGEDGQIVRLSCRCEDNR